MSDTLTSEEVATVIRARRLLREKGLSPNTDVKTLCDKVGISRKTGYQWEKCLETARNQEADLHRELEHIKAAHEKLKKDYDDIRFENEGRKIAWEIHEVDAFLAEKKSILKKSKKKKR